MSDVVTVVPYNPEWSQRFLTQSKLLSTALGQRITDLEHIGSTAVIGLPAKPIVDLAACAAQGVDPFALEPRIEHLGYRLHRAGPKNHAVYVRGSNAGRTEILHIFTQNAWQDCNQRVFRDKLQHDESARQRYGELKTTLAASTISGMDYTAAKRQLIEELLNQERAARGLPPTIAWDK